MTNTTNPTIGRDALNREAEIKELKINEDGEHCICCQRPMTSQQIEKAPHLHLVGGGLDFGPIDFDGGAGDVGLRPLGSTCARKIRKALKARGLDPVAYLDVSE